MLRIAYETEILKLTVEQTGVNEDLLFGQAREFAENLLKERGKLDQWTYDGAIRQNYHRIVVSFVRS